MLKTNKKIIRIIMKYLKKFNESNNQEFNINDYLKFSDKTILDLIGNPIESKDTYKTVTDLGVYTNLGKGDIDYISNDLVKVSSINKFEIYKIYLKSKGERYASEYGYLLLKDGKPHILSGINGDDRGATIFSGSGFDIFIVSGHDGSYLFNINNPLEYTEN
jgi:hypothetical protein